MNERTTIIKTNDLAMIYGMGEIQVAALDGVSIEIEAGEFVAVMGPSGSGKSTLMNILGCLATPSRGVYRLAGEDVSHLDKARLARIRNQKIGYVFQSYNLLPRTSALKNVMLPLLYDRESRLDFEQREVRAKTVMGTVGLGDRMYHEPQELSGGQQQRVAIARALISDPVLILADEPTGNLDSGSGEEIMQILHDLHRNGKTIVMVTHDPEIAAHTERTIHLLDGKVDLIAENGNNPHYSDRR